MRTGDLVIIGRNDNRLGLYNGTRASSPPSTSQTDSLTLRTDDDRDVTITATWAERHDLSHAYAMTLHKAQGLTVDHALLYGSEALTREAGYVGLSRGRRENHIYATTARDVRAQRRVRLRPTRPAPDEQQPIAALARRLHTSRTHELASHQIRRLGAPRPVRRTTRTRGRPQPMTVHRLPDRVRRQHVDDPASPPRQVAAKQPRFTASTTTGRHRTTCGASACCSPSPRLPSSSASVAACYTSCSPRARSNPSTSVGCAAYRLTPSPTSSTGSAPTDPASRCEFQPPAVEPGSGEASPGPCPDSSADGRLCSPTGGRTCRQTADKRSWRRRMGWVKGVPGQDGRSQYTAMYRDLRGQERSAGTLTSRRAANRAWQRAEPDHDRPGRRSQAGPADAAALRREGVVSLQ